MAITGAIFNSLIYGDVNSADYGVYISGDAVFNAPQRAVELVSVPGRNGSIAIDQGHFENIEVEYPAGMFGDDKTDFRQRLSDFRNAIMSKKGYQRLSDTYHPDEYRMGMYIEGLEVEPTHYNEAGQFTLKFNCKPQRYLTSGEEEIDVTDWSDVKTLSGESVTFDDGDASKGFQSIKTVFNPSQDGTPWKSEVESAPYLFRQSSGGTVNHEYDSESDSIVGGTVAWNQLTKAKCFDGSQGQWIDRGTTSGDATYLKVTPRAGSWGLHFDSNDFAGGRILANHKYLYSVEAKADDNDIPLIRFGMLQSWNWRTGMYADWQLTTSWQHFNKIMTYGETYSPVSNVQARADSTVPTYYRNFMFIDLTQMFGTTIADYIYSLEQTTAGSGIAKLKEWGFLDKDYYEYDADSLQSVNTSAHETIGKNCFDYDAWKNQTVTRATAVFENNGVTLTATGTDAYTDFNAGNPIPVTAGQQVIISWETEDTASGIVYMFNQNGSVIASNYATAKTCGQIIPNGTTSIKFRVGVASSGNTIHYKNIMVRKWGDATYEPYVKQSYPLDESVTLNGLFKLDANNNLYAGGDIYQPSGAVTRKYGKYEFTGAEPTWSKYTQCGSNCTFQVLMPTDAKMIVGEETPSMCDKYIAMNRDPVLGGTFKGYWIRQDNKTLYISDPSYTDVETFKASIAGMQLIYEKAEPTAETADPFTPIQDVSPYGTEQYIDYGVSQGTRDIAVPVGHQTKYIQRVPINKLDKIITYVSPTSDEEDATTYETVLGDSDYGGMVDVITGEFVKAWTGAVYTGQNLGIAWFSDCDRYQSGTVPTYGAYVVTTTMEEEQLTGQDVQILNGRNVIWTNGDAHQLYPFPEYDKFVEVTYGVEPGKIFNPTLFDAQPLLEVTGYGDIEFNGYKIELENGGRYEYVTLVENETKERVGTNNHEEISLTYPLDLRVFNTGDEFWAQISPRFWFTTSTIDLVDTLVSRSGIIWYDYSFFSFTNGTGILAIPTNNQNGFVKGTSRTDTGDLVLTISGHSGHDFSATVHATVAKIYDADESTLTFTASIDISDVQGTESMQNSRIELDVGASGFSTMTVLGNPTYIDCGLGEAYRYIDGEVVSLNKYIDLGSDLPVLSPGLNEVTYPSSVRGLLIKPNWWKI